MDVVVYTATFGDYDIPITPKTLDSRVRYVVFTDDPALRAEPPWEVVALDATGDPRMLARRVKVLAHEYLPDAEYSIWIDANLELGILPADILRQTTGHDLWVFEHPERDCVYDEAAHCVTLAKADADAIYRQVERYRKAGYPQNAGLAATAMVVRRHTDEVQAFNRAWWAEIEAGTPRDQLSFDYAAWTRGLEYGRLPWAHPSSGRVRTLTLWPHGVWGRTVDIVIPTLDPESEMLSRCLDSIERNTLVGHYNVIIGDNSAENFGFAKRVNQCIRESSADYIVLLNDDTEVTRGWLRNMIAIQRRDPEIVCIGPLSSAPSQPHQWVHSVAAKLAMNLPSRGYVTHEDIGLEMLSFWCTLFPRWVFDETEVGLLDERFFIYGEDTDWCWRAKNAGYKLALDLSTLVYHAHRQSYGVEARKAHAEAKRKLADKWGLISAKNIKVLIAVLNEGHMRVELASRILKWLQNVPPGIVEAQIYYPNHRPIQDNRNRIAKRVKEEGDWDYVLMLDDDVVPQRNPLELALLDKDVIGLPCQVYNLRRNRANPVYWNVMDWHPERGYWTPKDLNGYGDLLECDAVGAGAMLIHRRVLEHLDMRAPFNRVFDVDGLAVRGLDYEFCRRAREAGFEIWTHLDYYCYHLVTRNAGPLLEEAQQIYDHRQQQANDQEFEDAVDGPGRRV